MSPQAHKVNPSTRQISNCLPPDLAIRDASDKLSEGPINFGSRSSQNSTLQKSLAVKSSDHSWLAKTKAES
jgi:hypothetical protein